MYFKVYTWIQMILTAGMGLNIENVFTEGESNTANIFLITVLIARALYIISHCSVTLLGSLFYLISLFLPQSYIPALWWTAFAAEHLLQNLLVLVIRRVTPIEWSRYRVAFNIEHYIERFGFFTIIMLGEVIVNILWDSYTSTFSWSYVTTAAGLLVSISLQWLYYNVDGSRQYTHALRRSVPAAVMWTTLHYPFHLSIVLGGAAMSKVISLTLTKDLNGIKTVGKPFSTVDAGLRWALMGGLSASLFFLALLGVTHKSYEPKARPKLAKRGRMLVRLLVAVVFAPVVALWGEGLKATGMLVLAAGLCVGLTVVEEWGRLVSGKPGKKEKRKRKRRQAKEGESGKAESVVVEDVKDDGKEVVEDLYKKEVQPITIVD
ncbi:hypothetical protein BC829DRAFT_442311 [Chytridium lagenaria]|nr:hypothetical protein BC829DRAFT_442311 [Chytridium lagenaria]